MWFVLAIVGSLFGAFFLEVNRHFKQDGARLNMWRALLQLLIFSPLLVFCPWPTDLVFYLVGIVGGGVIALTDAYVWNVAAHHNGRVASMAGPVRTLTPFLLWFAVMPSSFTALWARPLDFALAIIGMGMMVWGGFHLRQNKIAWDAFRPMLLIGVFDGGMFVLRRLAVDVSDIFTQMMQLFFLHYAAVFILTALFLGGRYGREGFALSGDVCRAAALIGVSVLVSAQLLNVSVALAPNPGYPPAVYLLVPIWLMLYHKWRGVPDNASPYAASVVVLGVALTLVAAI